MKKFLLTAVLAFIGAWMFAQERIAVFPFEDIENILTSNQSFMLYDEFSNEFATRSASRFSVVPRLEVERLINTEMAFQLTDFSAQEKTAEMMRVQNASRILSGTIGKVDNNIRITVSLFTYPDLFRLPGGTTLSVANVNELFNRIPDLVQQMQNEIDNEPVPEGLRYEIVNGRTVTITEYEGNATVINIPAQIQGLPVTSIGDGAFARCSRLASVTIPSSVTYIGNWVFYDCGSLYSVTIPSSLRSIGSEAFSYCSRLTSITIPSSVTSIGDGAFSYCDSLTSVTIPASVRSIGYCAFSNSEKLISITVDSRNTAYASIDGVLFDKNIRTIMVYPAGKTERIYTIPSSVTSIEISAFSGCSRLTGVTIPSSVTSIGHNAFSGCSSLTNVTIPSSVRSIGEMAFNRCSSLTSITIPSSVTEIGSRAFDYCWSLTSVTLSRRTQVGEYAFPVGTRITYRD